MHQLLYYFSHPNQAFIHEQMKFIYNFLKIQFHQKKRKKEMSLCVCRDNHGWNKFLFQLCSLFILQRLPFTLDPQKRKTACNKFKQFIFCGFVLLFYCMFGVYLLLTQFLNFESKNQRMVTFFKTNYFSKSTCDITCNSLIYAILWPFTAI